MRRFIVDITLVHSAGINWLISANSGDWRYSNIDSIWSIIAVAMALGYTFIIFMLVDSYREYNELKLKIEFPNYEDSYIPKKKIPKKKEPFSLKTFLIALFFYLIFIGMLILLYKFVVGLNESGL